MSEDKRASGSTANLRHKLAAAEAELEEQRRARVAEEIQTARDLAVHCRDHLAAVELRTDERLDALERAEAMRQVREEERGKSSAAAPAEEAGSALSRTGQIGANAGGGTVGAAVIFGFGKLMGWW